MYTKKRLDYFYKYLKKTCVFFCSCGSIAVEKPNWTHSKSGKLEFSKTRHLSLEIDSMTANDTNCSADSHEIKGIESKGILEKKWARAYYKLYINNVQNKACKHYDYIVGELTTEQIKNYIKQYLDQNCEMNLLGGHRYKEPTEADGNSEILGITINNEYTLIFIYARYDGTKQISEKTKIATEIHENAAHENTVGNIGHCNDELCVNHDIAINATNENYSLCGGERGIFGCLKKLRNFTHVDK
jgi:hypothetical protein